MAQEAFMRAYRGLCQWRKDAAFSTWLFSLAPNLYCSEIRRSVPTVPLDEVPEPNGSRTYDGGLEDENRDEVVPARSFEPSGKVPRGAGHVLFSRQEC
jgi:DNA-directed RNA polymerase specialized sigma24 family protein